MLRPSEVCVVILSCEPYGVVFWLYEYTWFVALLVAGVATVRVAGVGMPDAFILRITSCFLCAHAGWVSTPTDPRGSVL
jgi:hypothetical protein